MSTKNLVLRPLLMLGLFVLAVTLIAAIADDGVPVGVKVLCAVLLAGCVLVTLRMDLARRR